MTERDERFKKPYDAPTKRKEQRFKNALDEVCKIMREREIEDEDRMMTVEEYIREKYNPQESIVIPSWAHRIAANYRGGIVLIDKSGERSEEIVVRKDGTIYLQ